MNNTVWPPTLLALLVATWIGCSSKAVQPAAPSPSSTPSSSTSTPPTTRGSSGLTAWQQRLLDGHNTLRRQVGIPDLAWSNDLAAYAQAWTNDLAGRRCAMAHRPQSPYGENIAQGTGLTARGAVALWGDEKATYEAASDAAARNTCNGRCGHYSQIVWKNSTTLGCGYAEACGLWVCNYDPPGNFEGEKPY